MKEVNALMNSGIRRRCAALGLVVLAALSTTAFAQMGGGSDAELQQKLAAVKQSAAENKQKLHQYQWTETKQVTLKGQPRPEQVYQCSYGPGGQVQKIPMGAQQQQQPQGGRLRQRIVEKKKEEMQEYGQQVQSVLSLYVPPNAQLMQQAFARKNVTMQKTPGTPGVNLVFKNYAKPGDQMTITFNPETKKMTNIQVNTYMDSPQDTVTLGVQMASLPDGTNYAQQTTLNASAKQLQVVTTSSNYVKIQ